MGRVRTPVSVHSLIRGENGCRGRIRTYTSVVQSHDDCRYLLCKWRKCQESNLSVHARPQFSKLADYHSRTLPKMDAGVGLKPTLASFKARGPIISRSCNGDCGWIRTSDTKVAASGLRQLGYAVKWWTLWDSNPHQLACKASVFPLAPKAQMVGHGRFELPTSRFQGDYAVRCANALCFFLIC